MKDKFSNHLKSSLLSNNKILLAVSGGVDSMVMLHLFLQSEVTIGIAHCNFQLRGQDSFDDEKLVLAEGSKHGIETHTIHFETKDYAERNGLSIQMAARELRYNWFEQIRKKYHYDYIATAHHGDDNIETFLLNLLRKTGISGLHGIKEKSGNIIRPMLFTNKEQIIAYAKKHNISYRNDISNTDDHYKRNYIRLHIIDEFKKLNPNFDKTLLDSMSIISKQEIVYKEKINQVIKPLLITEKEEHVIEIEKIKNLYPLDIYLFELLHPFGFNQSQVNDLIQCLDTTEEKTFTSSLNKLIKTRDVLKIIPLHKSEMNISLLESIDRESFKSVGIEMEIKETSYNFSFEKDPSIAYFDLDKIAFPIQIRNWQDGDSFYPFGGKGKKKLSDLFSDLKLNSIEKDKTRLLCNNNGDIIWVIGLRSDNRYRVTESTREMLILKSNL